MKLQTSYKIALLGMASLLLSACQNSGISSAVSTLKSNPINHTQWRLSQGSIDHRPLNLAHGNITLTITPNGEFSGNSGINQYRVAVQQQGAQLSVDEKIQTTRMMGSVEQMHLESEYLSALRRVTQSTEQNGKLQLIGEGVELQFQPSY